MLTPNMAGTKRTVVTECAHCLLEIQESLSFLRFQFLNGKTNIKDYTTATHTNTCWCSSLKKRSAFFHTYFLST